jgi:hypothetical protein
MMSANEGSDVDVVTAVLSDTSPAQTEHAISFVPRSYTPAGARWGDDLAALARAGVAKPHPRRAGGFGSYRHISSGLTQPVDSCLARFPSVWCEGLVRCGPIG